jgi:hypothetical protein
MFNRSVRADRREQARTPAGDDLLGEPIASATHAVTIRRSRRDVWPWLVQMVAGRAGWYAFDLIYNGDHPSAERILPEFQSIAVGSVLPASPGATEAFIVVEFEPERTLVLGTPSPDGPFRATWRFVLEEPEPDSTRLIVRRRLGLRPFGLAHSMAKLTSPVGHFIQRSQLLGIARRVEGLRGSILFPSRIGRVTFVTRSLWFIAVAFADTIGSYFILAFPPEWGDAPILLALLVLVLLLHLVLVVPFFVLLSGSVMLPRLRDIGLLRIVA